MKEAAAVVAKIHPKNDRDNVHDNDDDIRSFIVEREILTRFFSCEKREKSFHFKWRLCN